MLNVPQSEMVVFFFFNHLSLYNADNMSDKSK